eukprot:6194492-Pleurochrysis_carterae.AAC.1
MFLSSNCFGLQAHQRITIQLRQDFVATSCLLLYRIVNSHMWCGMALEGRVLTRRESDLSTFDGRAVV